MEDARRSDKQFGVALAELDSVKDERYPSPIPRILKTMADFLRKSGALEEKGIMRISSSRLLIEQVKNELNAGTFQGCRDVHAVAHLIGQWFAELPDPLLADVPKEALQNMSDQNAAWAIVQKLEEPNRSVLLWLLDLCVEVSREFALNSMTGQNIAIVLSPNLYLRPTLDMSPAEQQEILILFKQVNKFLQYCIHYRARMLE